MAERVTGTSMFQCVEGLGFLAREGGPDVSSLCAIESEGFRTLQEGQQVEFKSNRDPRPAGCARQTPVIPQLNQKIPPTRGGIFLLIGSYLVHFDAAQPIPGYQPARLRRASGLSGPMRQSSADQPTNECLPESSQPG